MIHISITQSPDSDVVGEVKWGKGSFSVGSGSESNLAIRDSLLRDIHLEIRAGSDGVCYGQVHDESFISINGRKSEGTVQIKKQDTVQMGKTVFVFKGATSEREDEALLVASNITSEQKKDQKRILQFITEVVGKLKN